PGPGQGRGMDKLRRALWAGASASIPAWGGHLRVIPPQHGQEEGKGTQAGEAVDPLIPTDTKSSSEGSCAVARLGLTMPDQGLGQGAWVQRAP
ncbi:hypothetical protein P7K49_004465, partial [Saguinus oedipus]